MKRILISAFACQPNRGSEYNINWNWAVGLAKLGYEVHCLTMGSNRPSIESVETPKNLHFQYVTAPLGLQVMQSFLKADYMYITSSGNGCYRKGKKLHKKLKFEVVHHVGWGVFS